LATFLCYGGETFSVTEIFLRTCYSHHTERQDSGEHNLGNAASQAE